MQNLSWNLRVVLGLVALVIIAIVGFGIYYTVIRISKDRPPDFENFPQANLVREETLSEGYDRLYFTSTGDAASIARFYMDQGFECVDLQGNVYEAGVLKENAYIQSTCLLDESHFLGFHQFARVIIQPSRTPEVRANPDDPASAITGGGELTGEVIIEVQRQWGNDGLLGG